MRGADLSRLVVVMRVIRLVYEFSDRNRLSTTWAIQPPDGVEISLRAVTLLLRDTFERMLAPIAARTLPLG
jgi:hypothetical protein